MIAKIEDEIKANIKNEMLDIKDEYHLASKTFKEMIKENQQHKNKDFS